MDYDHEEPMCYMYPCEKEDGPILGSWPASQL